jgi:hypothetical protein
MIEVYSRRSEGESAVLDRRHVPASRKAPSVLPDRPAAREVARINGPVCDVLHLGFVGPRATNAGRLIDHLVYIAEPIGIEKWRSAATPWTLHSGGWAMT